MIIIPSIDRKFFVRWVLVFSLITQLLPVILPLVDEGYELSIQNSYVLNRTYVKTIEGDMQSRISAKKSLDYFNSLGNNSIVKYEAPSTTFTRPIVIKVQELSFIDNLLGLAGYALPTPWNCTIVIAPWEDEVMFEQVLIHEYLHCMGYLAHSGNRNDIMYEAYKPVYESNIIKYAEDLKDKLE